MEEARPLCIHKLPPGFMTRAAAEPLLSVHYHSSIAFCVYDGYPVGEIYSFASHRFSHRPTGSRKCLPPKPQTDRMQVTLKGLDESKFTGFSHNSICDLSRMKSLPSVN